MFDCRVALLSFTDSTKCGTTDILLSTVLWDPTGNYKANTFLLWAIRYCVDELVDV